MRNETQKAYIGSSIYEVDWIYDHFKNLNSNIHLQRAFAKYGLKEFSLYILEFLPKDPNLSDVEHLAALTQSGQKYIDLFDEKYNINPVAGKSRLGSKHSEATKELMSKWRKENPAFLNKVHSEDILEQARERMTDSNNPMYGKPVTEANKKLISELFLSAFLVFTKK